MSCPSDSENLQSETAKGGHPYAFSPLPQEDDSDISSFSIELRGSEDNEPACAVYTKLAFIGLIISYNIFTYNYLPSPTIVLDPNSFAISNFTIFYSRLAANWEADFSFGCQNCGYNLTSPGNDRTGIYYDHIKAYVFYNEGDMDVLSTASIEPFNLGSAKEHKKVNVKFGHTGWEGNQPIVRKKVVNEIGEQVERGVLNLGVRFDIWVTYKKWGSFWKSSLLGLPDSYCWDLVVGVMPETGKGRLILSRTKYCSELYYTS